ncbi:MAG: agmatinase family protein [Bdellovibrionota bacterium]
MAHFDPNAAAGAESGIFGLPFSYEQASLVYLPVPWEATTSYGGGTSKGPEAIFEASKQVDLYDLDVVKPYEAGLHMLPLSKEVQEWNAKAKTLAAGVIQVGGEIGENAELQKSLAAVNDLGGQLNSYVYRETRRLMAAGKLVGLVGGDHSTPFGAFQAVGEKYPGFGILHFDAHSDTRNAYEGFTWSHASIMHNALTHIPALGKLVQVGIRDICEQEVDFVGLQKSRVSVFYDRDCARRIMEGISWAQICREIVALLPNEVWVSFDIDGLDPRFCPHTGTPVPGGLDFHQANYLLSVLVKSGRRIVGFDLNEVAPNLADESDEWDANVGARLLYKLTGWTLASQSKAALQF